MALSRKNKHLIFYDRFQLIKSKKIPDKIWAIDVDAVKSELNKNSFYDMVAPIPLAYDVLCSLPELIHI